MPITFDVRATTAYKVGPQAGISATPTDEVAPLAPTNLSAAVGDGIVDLSWAEPPGGTPAANYELTYRVVEARKNGPSTSTELSQSIPPSARSEIVGSLTRLVAGTLPNGQQITFNLVAVNTYGSSSAAVVKATPGAGSPSALYASGGPKKVTLSWEPPMAGLAGYITGYDVYRTVLSGSFIGSTPVNGATLIAASATSYTVTGLSAGDTYHFVVVAVGADAQSWPSPVASATAPP